jgi:hypothetical protein
MPIVANPLASELVLEGIRQAGEANPSSTLLARAQNEWLEEIKNDIWHLAKKPKVLHVTAYTTMNTGQSRYAYPSDYSSDLSLTTLSGTDVGICQSGGVNNVTLAATDGSTTNIIGKEILMTGGTSKGSYAQIVSYNSSTKLAGVIPDFNTIPVVGDTYMIVDVEYPIIVKPINEWERVMKLVTPGLPQFAYPVGDDQQGYFVLNCPPDKGYGMRLRYYADLSQIDTTSTLLSVIYRRWRNIFIQGIKAKKLLDEDDDRQQTEEAKYKANLMALIYREIYGMDLSNITDIITDYQ